MRHPLPGRGTAKALGASLKLCRTTIARVEVERTTPCHPRGCRQLAPKFSTIRLFPSRITAHSACKAASLTSRKTAAPQSALQCRRTGTCVLGMWPREYIQAAAWSHRCIGLPRSRTDAARPADGALTKQRGSRQLRARRKSSPERFAVIVMPPAGHRLPRRAPSPCQAERREGYRIVHGCLHHGGVDLPQDYLRDQRQFQAFRCNQS